MTWYGQTTAWSLWGNASNTSSNDERSSEKYAAGGRSRFNLTDYDSFIWSGKLAGQTVITAIESAMCWPRVMVASFWMARYTVSALNSAPGVRYDKYTDNASETQPLGYASGAYAWQLTDNAKFTQGVSVFGAEDTTLNSESALNVAINEHFGLKVALQRYMELWTSRVCTGTYRSSDNLIVRLQHVKLSAGPCYAVWLFSFVTAQPQIIAAQRSNNIAPQIASSTTTIFQCFYQSV